MSTSRWPIDEDSLENDLNDSHYLGGYETDSEVVKRKQRKIPVSRLRKSFTADSIDELRTKVAVDSGWQVRVTGYLEVGDTSDILFFSWDATSYATDNGFSVVKPTNILTENPGRWVSRPRFLDSVEELRKVEGVEDQSIQLSGYYEVGDVSDIPPYYWDSSSTEEDNGGSVLGSFDVGRWVWKEVSEASIEQFGGLGDGINDDSLYINNAVQSNISVLKGTPGSTYLLKESIVLKSNFVFDLNHSTILQDPDIILGSGDVVLSVVGLDSVKILNGIFTSNGDLTQAVRFISLSEATNVTVRDLLFTGINGTCFRCNKSEYFEAENIRFVNITGIDLNPGEGFYSLGLLHARFTNISCLNLGDHLFYIQGSDTEDWNRVEDVSIRGVNASQTGTNGLTGGAAIVFYGRCKDVIVDGVVSESCPITVQLSSKPEHLTAIHDNIVLRNILAEGGSNAGIYLYTDELATESIKNITLENITFVNCRTPLKLYNAKSLIGSDIKIIGCNTYGVFMSAVDDVLIRGLTVRDISSQVGVYMYSSVNVDISGLSVKGTLLDSAIKIDNSTNVVLKGVVQENTKEGIELLSGCRDIYLDVISTYNSSHNIMISDCFDISLFGNYSYSVQGYGIFVTGTDGINIQGVKSVSNALANINVGSDNENIYVINPILFPSSSNDDPLIVPTDSNTYCRLVGCTPRDEGNIVRSEVFANSIPIEGFWNKGDRVYTVNPAAAGFIGWVCVTLGTPGTWKTFGVISA